MADVRPFRALRPPAELAVRVAAPPYDVVDVAEARALAAGNPYSFLHVSRPEIDLPDDVDPHGDPVYEAGRRRFEAFVADGVLVADAAPSYYLYRQTVTRDGVAVHEQTGLVACTSVADYVDGVIRTHEFTRPDKEDDRVRHIDALDAHDEPVLLLTAPDDPAAAKAFALLGRVPAGAPDVDLTTDDGIRHRLWSVADAALVADVRAAFAEVPELYVADGHHRSAAAARVAALREAAPDSEAAAFLAVIFPGEELAILAYNRVVADLLGRTPAEFLAELESRFHVERVDEAFEPAQKGTVAMCLAGDWYELRLDLDLAPADDPVAQLDVSLLQDQVLASLLGVADPRTDARISFVGGIRGTGELERRVIGARAAGRDAVAFALHPTSVADLVAVAATGRVMPPKSTWFEPKLRSGLFVHALHV